MLKIVSTGAAALAFSAVALAPVLAANPAGAPAKMSSSDCKTLWGTAAGSTGDLAMDKASPYVKDFKSADVNSDGKLSQSEWMDACNKGMIQSAEAGTGAGVPQGKTSDRSGGKPVGRTPNATDGGAAGVDAGKTPSGTSDRTPSK